MTPESPLDILLIEDNPGDARYIREVLAEATELSRRATDGDGALDDAASRYAGTPELVHESRLAAGLERLAAEPPDVVLLDLNLPDSDGLDTLSTLREQNESVPVVVLTGLRDRETGMEALRRGADEYLVKDEINADLLLRSVYHVIERKAHERELERQREQVAALNQVYEVLRGIIDEILEGSTREAIERAVCERLAASESYEFAWIGEVDAHSQRVVARVEAGVEGYVEEAAITVDDDCPRGQGPAAQALLTHETRTLTDVAEDPSFEPWRELGEKYGYRSGIAIPVVHDQTPYGVLCVYASRVGAFEGPERDVLGQLGEIVGHAIAAVERKRALVADHVTEIDFRVQDFFDELGVSVTPEEPLSFERIIPVDDRTYLAYGTAKEAVEPVLQTLTESDDVPYWTEVHTRPGPDDHIQFELQLSAPPVLTAVVSQGGYVSDARIENGDYYLTVQLPPEVESRRVIDAVMDVQPDAELLAQRQTTRDDDGNRAYRTLAEELTDRQRTALETAYFAGYFDWPRESSGEDVAELMGVTPATFHQHLRLAERLVFRSLLDGAADD